MQCLPLREVVVATHIEYSNKRSLQQPHQHVAPVVLVIRDSGVTHIHRKGHQEELDGGPEKSGPLSHKSRLHVKLKDVEKEQRVVDHRWRRDRKEREIRGERLSTRVIIVN